MAQINIGRILPIFQGSWRGDRTYEKLDIVYYNGNSYVAKETNINKIPNETTVWQVVAIKGENGGVNYSVGTNTYNDYE